MKDPRKTALQDLKRAMSDDHKSHLEKMTIMAKDRKGLMKGLNKGKEILEDLPKMEPMMSDEKEEYSDEEESDAKEDMFADTEEAPEMGEEESDVFGDELDMEDPEVLEAFKKFAKMYKKGML